MLGRCRIAGSRSISERLSAVKYAINRHGRTAIVTAAYTSHRPHSPLPRTLIHMRWDPPRDTPKSAMLTTVEPPIDVRRDQPPSLLVTVSGGGLRPGHAAPAAAEMADAAAGVK